MSTQQRHLWESEEDEKQSCENSTASNPVPIKAIGCVDDDELKKVSVYCVFLFLTSIITDWTPVLSCVSQALRKESKIGVVEKARMKADELLRSPSFSPFARSNGVIGEVLWQDPVLKAFTKR